MSDFSDKIIFGKNGLESVVSVEAEDGFLNIFTENNGVVASQKIINKYWILSPQPYDNNFIKLDGELHYKWGKQYDTRKSFLDDRRQYKNQNRDIFSIYDPREASLINKGISYYKGMQPKDVSILAFDLETTGLTHDSSAKILLIANTLRKNGITTRKLFCYDDYASEQEFLAAWVKYVVSADPSILCGHNIITFDFQYLKYIADRCNVKLNLGRNNSPLEFYKYTSKFRVDGNRDQEFTNIRCYGREILDTYMLAIRYDATEKKYESYGLKQIIKQENLEVAGRVFYDAGQIRNNYTNPIEWEKIKAYAINDGDDALSLADKMLPAFFYLSNTVPKPFQQIILSGSGSQINSILLRAYIQDRHSIPKADEIVEKVSGGLSFVIPGIYNNVLKGDLKSAYPSQILKHSLFEEKKDPKGYYLYITKYFTNRRFELKALYKKTKDNNVKAQDDSAKIGANSLYGALNTKGLNFNSQRLANFITEETRKILKTCIEWATDKNYNDWKVDNKLEELM